MKPIHPKQPKGMSDKAFKSFIKRNNITSVALTALAASIERGKVKCA